MFSQSEEVNIDNIITDINNVISKHFKNILTKYNNEKSELESFIKGIPIVKKIIKDNETLREQNAFLKRNLDSLSMKYNELFIRHNKISLSVKLDKIEVINPVSKSKKNNNGEKENNIQLVIKDTEMSKNDINISDIEKEVEASLDKKKQEQMEKINASIASYSMLEGADDDDGEEYVVESEDEEYLSSEKAWMKAHNEEDVDEDDVDEDDVEEAEEDDAEEAKEEEVDEDDAEEAEEDDAEEAKEEEVDEDDVEEAEEDDAEEAEEEEVDEDDAEEEEEVDEDDAEEEDDDEEYDEELIEIEVDGVTYYASETKDGKIYAVLENDEIGDDVGHYVNGEPIIF